MKAETGILVVTTVDREYQMPTFTCPHCSRVGIVNEDDGGWCFKCGRLLCKSESCHKDCDPMIRRLG